MKLLTTVVGYLRTNCYIIEKGNNCLIIDPGDEATKIIENINKEVKGIIITHYHDDHIGALDELLKKYKTNVYDIHNMKEGKFSIANFSFEVIYTPGHKEDCISIYFKDEEIMLVGDFIFKDSIGRCDLPGGNTHDMQRSIDKILKYDDAINLYPGHYENTSLKDERRNLEMLKNII